MLGSSHLSSSGSNTVTKGIVRTRHFFALHYWPRSDPFLRQPCLPVVKIEILIVARQLNRLESHLASCQILGGRDDLMTLQSGVPQSRYHCASSRIACASQSLSLSSCWKSPNNPRIHSQTKLRKFPVSCHAMSPTQTAALSQFPLLPTA